MAREAPTQGQPEMTNQEEVEKRLGGPYPDYLKLEEVELVRLNPSIDPEEEFSQLIESLDSFGREVLRRGLLIGPSSILGVTTALGLLKGIFKLVGGEKIHFKKEEF